VADRERALLELAAATAAAAVARLSAERAAAGIRAESHHDIKIDADFLLHELIVTRLSEGSGLPAISEEDEAGVDAGDAGRRWIVDPLDGSLNFSRGIPVFGVSIGLWDGMTPLLGVVHDAARGEVLAGIVGQGAWLDGHVVTVSSVAEPARAVLCTGFPSQTDHGGPAVTRFVESVRAFRKVRCIGSAALALAYVACGRADAYHEDDVALWDVAAGLALVEAAGGTVVFTPTTTGRRTFAVTATNGILDAGTTFDRKLTAR
jgi:fructose-1,6-bisphosphatase/inositol monophosphatase family enzyme